MKFFKENWFKLLLSLFIVVVIGLGVLFLLEYRTKDSSYTAESGNTKSDNYVVTQSADGNPVTWTTIEHATAVFSDTLSTYEKSLSEIQKIQDAERANVTDMYKAIANAKNIEVKESFKSLIVYEDDYIAAGENLITLLNNLIQNYQGLLKTALQRDPVMYMYYSERVGIFESQKDTVLSDYEKKLEAKQEYAKSLLLK